MLLMAGKDDGYPAAFIVALIYIRCRESMIVLHCLITAIVG